MHNVAEYISKWCIIEVLVTLTIHRKQCYTEGRIITGNRSAACGKDARKSVSEMR